jgi:hypothetical protein
LFELNIDLEEEKCHVRTQGNNRTPPVITLFVIDSVEKKGTDNTVRHIIYIKRFALS